MEPSKDQIKAWMKKFGHTRSWLGEKAGKSKNTVNNWLSTNIDIPDDILALIRGLIAEDERAESEQTKKDAGEPERFSVELNVEEFDRVNRAALKHTMTIREYAAAALVAAADADMAGKFAIGFNKAIEAPAVEESTVPFPTKKAHIMAAAGSPLSAEVIDWEGDDDTVRVEIYGLSMAPLLNDGDVVTMKHKKVSRNPHMKKGMIYLVEYDGGYLVKRYETRKAKPEELDEEWVQKGKVIVLQSENPDFPEIIVKGPLEWIAWLDEDAVPTA